MDSSAISPGRDEGAGVKDIIEEMTKEKIEVITALLFSPANKRVLTDEQFKEYILTEGYEQLDPSYFVQLKMAFEAGFERGMKVSK